MELKLLTFATLKDAPARQQVVTAALRAETQQLEARMAALIDAHEKAISEMQQATSAALAELRGQVSTLQTELASAQERAARAEQEHGERYQQVLTQVEQVHGNVQEIDKRIVSGEGKVEMLSQGVTVLQEYGATRMQEFEQALRAQSAEIALVSASQVQTDDLVEGVVAAMELLQSSVFDYTDK
jgi:chromosome segregation ATPase